MKTPLGGVIAFTLSTAAALAQQPAITQVVDGGAYTADVAQGSVFVVKGTSLSGAGLTSAPAPTYPTTLNNVQISFTPVAGGAAVQALMVYTYNIDGVNQLAAVLPSNVATGAYDARVINGSATSAASRVNVVARKPGIVTAAGNGAGPAQATLAGALILDRLADVGKLGTFDTRPGRRGERMDLWGTGLGPDRASDTGGSSGDQTAAASIRVIVGGIEVTPAYAGRSQGFPGLDQIAFTLPSTLAAGCFVPVQVRAGSVLSNVVSVALSDGSVCSDATISADMARKLSLGSAVTAGTFSAISNSIDVQGLGLGTTYAEYIAGSFASMTGDVFFGSKLNTTASGCNVFKQTGDLSQLAFGVPLKGLDAGASLTGAKPDNSTVTLAKQLDFLYQSPISSGSTRNFTTGTFRLSGTGGADVGAFTAQVAIPNFAWSNKAAISAINRSQDLNLTWTGGGTGLVSVIGFSGHSISGTGVNAVFEGGGFICLAPASAGSLSVPASTLQQLVPANFNPLSLLGGNISLGVLSVNATSDGQNGKFTAPLTRGGSIDLGLFSYLFGESKLLSVQ